MGHFGYGRLETGNRRMRHSIFQRHGLPFRGRSQINGQFYNEVCGQFVVHASSDGQQDKIAVYRCIAHNGNVVALNGKFDDMPVAQLEKFGNVLQQRDWKMCSGKAIGQEVMKGKLR